MKRTNIYLDEAQRASLDKLAEQQGVSRAEFIRQLLNRALNNADDNLVSDLAAINDSFGALCDFDKPERSPSSREKHLDRVWRSTS
jgi:Arc/MetJ-type ribon-helix-helix transcriptional regulator